MQRDKHTQAHKHVHTHSELLLSFGLTSDLLFIQTADDAQLSHIIGVVQATHVHGRTHQRCREDDYFSILQTYRAPGNQRVTTVWTLLESFKIYASPRGIQLPYHVLHCWESAPSNSRNLRSSSRNWSAVIWGSVLCWLSDSRISFHLTSF